MAARLGLKAKLYYRTTVNSGTWNEIGNCKNVTLNLEKGEADVTTRTNNGWRATIGTLKDGSVEFQMVWDDQDTAFQAIRDAWLNDTVLEFAVMSGALTDPTSEGLNAVMSVLNFSRSEELEEAIMVDCTVKPTYHTTHQAQWMNGGA